MSIDLMSEVWRRCVYGTEQQVLLVLCDYANDDGSNCYPSVPLIAWKLGVSDRTVRRIIKELERRGVIGITRKDGKANQYQVRLDALDRKQPLTQLRHPRQNVTPDTAVSGHPGHNNVTPTPDTAVSPNPSIEPSVPTNMPSNVIRVDPPAAPAEPKEKGKRPEHGPAQQIMAAFCDAVGIDRLPDYKMAGGQAQNLVKAGITAEDIPDMVSWCFEQSWMNGGIDLGTLYRHMVKWRTDRAGRQRKPAGPPGVELLPGETAVDLGGGKWELRHENGYTRLIDPSYYGIVFDPRIHKYDGLDAFYAAVAEARAKAEGVAA